LHGQAAPIAGLDALHRAPFAVMDVLRRAQGDVLGALGLDPRECAYRVVDSGTHWRLRDYAGQDASPALLIVAGPIKRPYIWDLCPSASAIRYCLRHRLHVYLLEWLPASGHDGCNGIAEYTEAISRCLATISRASLDAKPFIIGHSLGGTLAAIFGTLAPERIRGLVLLGAPLCFEPGTSQFRDGLASFVPTGLSDEDPFPGSLLSHLSALASPRTFIWSRLLDAALSSDDYHALEVHARVERWALDEVPLPGRLVSQIVEWLYREDRLCRGTLRIGDALAAPSGLCAPTLAVVSESDEVAPMASVKPFADAIATRDVRVIQYAGEVGVCLQHLGVLIGRRAHTTVWPEIVAWMASRR
jgi:polyhydroxyalkanoate synthase